MILNIIKLVWVVANFIVLGFTLSGFCEKVSNDIVIVFAWSMLALSFPMGSVISFIYFILDFVFFIKINDTFFSIFITWLGIFLVGYFQWFVFIPAVVRWLRRPRG